MKEKERKLKEFIHKNIKWIILFACLICFLAIVEDVFDNEIETLDAIGYNLISKLMIFRISTPALKFITNFGGPICLVGVAIISCIVIENRKMEMAICLNLPISAILNFSLKNILQRPRPIGNRIINEVGYSLPSGHSMVSLAFYGLIIYFIYKNVKNKKIKWTLITILSLLIVFIGISRIYLGVHYTSDVLAGFLVAINYLIIYISIFNKFFMERD